MAYIDLTDEEKADIALADAYYRGRLSTLSRNMSESSDEMAEFISSVVDPLIAGLVGGDIIPNSTNLGGAQELTVAQWLGIQSFLADQVTMKADNISVITKAVGVNI